MFNDQHASVAVLGYRHAPSVSAGEIVQAIDAILQTTDAEPRQVRWLDDSIAIIDRVGVRIAIGVLPPSKSDRYTYLAIAVGQGTGSQDHDDMLSVSHAHLADRLVYRIKDDLPYDTVMRGETPETVDEMLVVSLFELLRQTGPAPQAQAPANQDTKPEHKSPQKRVPAEERFDVILSDEVLSAVSGPPAWAERRAEPTQALRLTVHTMALSIMLYTAPLGAFLFTYSMLRDVSANT